jgi:hypothetical protein
MYLWNAMGGQFLIKMLQMYLKLMFWMPYNLKI